MRTMTIVSKRSEWRLKTDSLRSWSMSCKTWVIFLSVLSIMVQKDWCSLQHGCWGGWYAEEAQDSCEQRRTKVEDQDKSAILMEVRVITSRTEYHKFSNPKNLGRVEDGSNRSDVRPQKKNFTHLLHDFYGDLMIKCKIIYVQTESGADLCEACQSCPFHWWSRVCPSFHLLS